MVDSLTLGVLTTLFLDALFAVLILIGFACVRKYRGDKQSVNLNRHTLHEPNHNEGLFQIHDDNQSLESHLIEEEIVKV